MQQHIYNKVNQQIEKIGNLPLNTILQIKSILIAKAIAETPKKKPEGE